MEGILLFLGGMFIGFQIGFLVGRKTALDVEIRIIKKVVEEIYKEQTKLPNLIDEGKTETRPGQYVDFVDRMD